MRADSPTQTVNKNNSDFVGVKVDMANAFNRMARQQMILAVNNLPGLARWVVVCMAQHSVLWFGSSRLSSEEGGQQGDPLIPLLFALVLHPLIKKIENLGPAANLWFVDDGTIWGSHKVVAEALALLDGPDAKDLGIHLNHGKCEVIWLRNEFVKEDAFPAKFTKRIRNGNFTIVGTIMGDDKYVTEEAMKLLKDAE